MIYCVVLHVSLNAGSFALAKVPYVGPTLGTLVKSGSSSTIP